MLNQVNDAFSTNQAGWLINANIQLKYMTETQKNALIQALLNPRFYQYSVDQVELLETHISWVLLAGEFAYKIKKPVDFGFLDFSTLEKRERCCRDELRLNQR